MNHPRTYIIAEAGVNHNGSLEMACQLVDKAAEAGADAVKFQTFKAECLASRIAPKAEYQVDPAAAEGTQLEMLRKLELKPEYHYDLMKKCQQRSLEFLSTPFDNESLRFLVDDLGVRRIKLSSGEITNAPLLYQAARTGLPIILSTGMSTLGEIEEALGVLAYGYLGGESPSCQAFIDTYQKESGWLALQEKVVLLHCTTEYPAPLDEVNLRAIKTMRNAFGLSVGYSDHTEGLTAPIAAVALGASVIEKHFTLDRSLPGPDHKASLEPEELKKMVDAIRQVELSLGSGRKIPAPSERKNQVVTRKSLVAARNIICGEKFSEENLTVKRPGDGKSPMQYWEYIGRQSKLDYQMDDKI